MECKWCFERPMPVCVIELIDTLWNVNLNQQSLSIPLLFELIDTLWDVKIWNGIL